MFDCDYLIVGSGFGGSASALRLAEKGWNVVVVEQGRRIGSTEIKAGKDSVFKLMWMPSVRLRGSSPSRQSRCPDSLLESIRPWPPLTTR